MDQTGAWPRASWLSRVRLPWRLGILLALLSFLVLHSMAALPLPASRGVDNLSSYLIAQLFGGLASWLQYVLPLALPWLLQPQHMYTAAWHVALHAPRAVMIRRARFSHSLGDDAVVQQWQP